jgi:hypothetical protein
LQRPAGDDGGRDHHAAGHLALNGQEGAPAQHRDLRQQARALRHGRENDVAILGDDLGLQGRGSVASPDLDRLGDHGERVDDLRIARHRIKMEVGLDLGLVGLREWGRGRALVEQGEDEQQDRRDHDDEAEMRMDQEDRQNEDRCDRRVEERDQRARHEERPDLLEVAERLVLAPVSVQRGAGGRAQHGRAQLSCDLDRGAHQDEAPDRIEHRLQHDRADDDGGQHDQRVDRAAGQNAVRYLEQIDRDGEDEDVARHREDHDDGEVAPDHLDAGFEQRVEIDRAEALVEHSVPAAIAALAAARRQ